MPIPTIEINDNNRYDVALLLALSEKILLQLRRTLSGEYYSADVTMLFKPIDGHGSDYLANHIDNITSLFQEIGVGGEAKIEHACRGAATCIELKISSADAFRVRDILNPLIAEDEHVTECNLYNYHYEHLTPPLPHHSTFFHGEHNIQREDAADYSYGR